MALAVLGIIGVLMLVESRLSMRNERRLRAAGAVEPPGDVYRTMQIAYPACFVVMALEGLMRGDVASEVLVAGAAVFASAKALKYWAIASLGVRWSFRVLVLPGTPLVTTGPYRVMRHPNYAAVVGELVGSALLFGAPIAGTAGTLFFGDLLRRRIRVEQRALGL